jgi:hypothetical protein
LKCAIQEHTLVPWSCGHIRSWRWRRFESIRLSATPKQGIDQGFGNGSRLDISYSWWRLRAFPCQWREGGASTTFNRRSRRRRSPTHQAPRVSSILLGRKPLLLALSRALKTSCLTGHNSRLTLWKGRRALVDEDMVGHSRRRGLFLSLIRHGRVSYLLVCRPGRDAVTWTRAKGQRALCITQDFGPFGHFHTWSEVYILYTSGRARSA